jgi:anti-sigma regulatory factor (Ser/Thr protein kinase)
VKGLKEKVVRQDHFELAVDPTAPMYARWRTRLAVLTWDLPDLADDAELLVTELVTNAVRASNGVVRLWLTADHDSLMLAVWDDGDGMPARCEVGPFEPGGRGLMIVDALSTSWGSYAAVPGKVVWCQITNGGSSNAQ